jgi:hypothetical protein
LIYISIDQQLADLKKMKEEMKAKLESTQDDVKAI